MCDSKSEDDLHEEIRKILGMYCQKIPIRILLKDLDDAPEENVEYEINDVCIEKEMAEQTVLESFVPVELRDKLHWRLLYEAPPAPNLDNLRTWLRRRYIYSLCNDGGDVVCVDHKKWFYNPETTNEKIRRLLDLKTFDENELASYHHEVLNALIEEVDFHPNLPTVEMSTIHLDNLLATIRSLLTLDTQTVRLFNSLSVRLFNIFDPGYVAYDLIENLKIGTDEWLRRFLEKKVVIDACYLGDGTLTIKRLKKHIKKPDFWLWKREDMISTELNAFE